MIRLLNDVIVLNGNQRVSRPNRALGAGHKPRRRG
jgi:hypothetical protein